MCQYDETYPEEDCSGVVACTCNLPGVMACTSNKAFLEGEFRNGVGSVPIGGNSSSIGGWIV